jgi:hypothetical protein
MNKLKEKTQRPTTSKKGQFLPVFEQFFAIFGRFLAVFEAFFGIPIHSAMNRRMDGAQSWCGDKLQK